MDSTEFRDILHRLRLSQQALGRLLGVSKATPQRWAKSGVDGPAELLVWLLRDGTVTADSIEKTKARHRAVLPPANPAPASYATPAMAQSPSPMDTFQGMTETGLPSAPALTDLEVPQSPRMVRWKDREGREYYTDANDPRRLAMMGTATTDEDSTPESVMQPPAEPLRRAMAADAPTSAEADEVADAWQLPPRR